MPVCLCAVYASSASNISTHKCAFSGISQLSDELSWEKCIKIALPCSCGKGSCYVIHLSWCIWLCNLHPQQMNSPTDASFSLVGHKFLWFNNPIMLCFTCISNPLFLSAVVWTAASATTAMKPTLVASPASPTAPLLSPGATDSPVLVCKPATLLPQRAAAMCRALRPRLSTPLTPCLPAAPAASATHHAASSSKAWTPETATSSLVTWVILMYFARALMTTTTMTIWPMGECLHVLLC